MKSTHKTTCLMLLIFALASATSISGCITDDGKTEIIPKTLEQYKQEMTSFIAAEKAVVENCVVGYNKGDFKTAATFESTRDNYLLALTAAEAVLKKENVTIPEIVAANKTLASPGKAFTGSLWISDRRPLNDAIVAAEALNSATPEGTEKGQAPTQAKTTFTDAITAATAVRGASATIDRQVTEAITKLEEAKQNFLKAIIK